MTEVSCANCGKRVSLVERTTRDGRSFRVIEPHQGKYFSLPCNFSEVMVGSGVGI